MLLCDKFPSIHMSKMNIVVSYITKILKLRDQFVAKRTVVKYKELVYISLNPLLPSWRILFKVFVLLRTRHPLQIFGMTLCRKRLGLTRV